jgi:hypothetical protein
LNRRKFLRQGAGAVLGCSGELGFLSRLAPVSASEVGVEPGVVRFDPVVEPLVRLFEDTPRERLLEEVAARIAKGLSYREGLAALLLAGIRNVQPRPTVGFKFHTVLVVHSAHLVAQGSPETERWLPFLWAVDHFKGAQAADARQGDWTMAAVDPRAVPPAKNAVRVFTEAMNHWDETAADGAAAGIAGSLGAEQAFEVFAPYAARDLRSIGHKAIYLANGWRTLDTIGWQHAEPVLRSLAYAFLAREGSDPTTGDDPADRPWHRNRVLARGIPASWQAGRVDRGATSELLAVVREGNEDETADRVADLLRRGIAPSSIWDALLCGAAEILMRSPGIVPLHAVTTTNAIRYAYERVRSDETRRLLLLQNASFLPFFRRSEGSRGPRIDEIPPLESERSMEKAIEDISAAIGRDNPTAARLVLGYLSRGFEPRALLDAFNRLVFIKGNDSHDYKFSAALLEDYYRLSPSWRGPFLAAGVFWLNGLQAPDNDLVARARRALAG